MKNILDYIIEAFNNQNNGDEFYTQIKDIEKELSHYNLSGKKVYCNCDNPEFSNFYKYLKDNFKKLNLKKLIATYYSDEPKKYVFDGNNEKITDIKSGLFQDNTKIMKECDIVITNPPFSDNLPAKLVNILFKNDMDFIIVGPLHMCLNNDVFEYIKDEKMRAGYTGINTFIRPDGTKKNAPCSWWTNLNVNRKEFTSNIKYDKTKYKKYDNYDAIDCNPSKTIPDDYDGEMGVPYRFLTHINEKQFKIIKKLNPKLNGKNLMARIIIKRK